MRREIRDIETAFLVFDSALKIACDNYAHGAEKLCSWVGSSNFEVNKKMKLQSYDYQALIVRLAVHYQLNQIIYHEKSSYISVNDCHFVFGILCACQKAEV
jgi:hypothetical protein